MGLLGDLATEPGHEKMQKLHVFNRLPTVSAASYHAGRARSAADNRLDL
jgi:hypothetical protein